MISKEIKLLCERGDFSAAADLLQKQPDLAPAWLKKSIKKRVKITHKIKAYQRPNAVRARLASLYGFENASVYETKVAGNGLISVLTLIHDLGHVKVFEKVVASKKSFDRERVLFNIIDPRLLCAPNFYGSFSDGTLYSTFYRAIDIEDGVSDCKKDLARAKIACHIWSLAIREPNLKPKASTFKVSELSKNNERISDVLQAFEATNGKKLVFLKYLEQFNLSERFLFHGDMGRQNVIFEHGDCFLIDWDKWGFVPIGSGCAFSQQNYERLEIKKIIMRSFRNNKHAHDALSNFIFYNLCNSFLKQKAKDFAFYSSELNTLNSRD